MLTSIVLKDKHASTTSSSKTEVQRCDKNSKEKTWKNEFIPLKRKTVVSKKRSQMIAVESGEKKSKEILLNYNVHKKSNRK